MAKKAAGRRLWAFSGGHIPLNSAGAEPSNTSHDKLSILNATDEKAAVALTIFFSDRDAIGPYELEVESRRLRSFRFNDLIDPLPIELDKDYACVIESNVPIVVQFTRLDTSSGQPISLSLMAFPDD